MKRPTSFFFILLSVWLMLGSCIENDTMPSKTMLLTQSGWKYSVFTSTDSFVQSYLAIALLGSEISFNTNKTSILTFSSTVNSVQSTYTWAFSADEKNLLLTDSNGTVAYELVVLNGSNLDFRTSSGGIINVYRFIKK